MASSPSVSSAVDAANSLYFLPLYQACRAGDVAGVTAFLEKDILPVMEPLGAGALLPEGHPHYYLCQSLLFVLSVNYYWPEQNDIFMIGMKLFLAGADFGAIIRLSEAPHFFGDCRELPCHFASFYSLFYGLCRNENRDVRLDAGLAAVLVCMRYQDGELLLHVAARQGNLARVNALLNQDACVVDARDGCGCTALMNAVERGHVDVARALLAAKAKVSAYSTSGDNVLQMAVHASQVNMVRLLLPHCTLEDLLHKNNDNAASNYSNMDVLALTQQFEACVPQSPIFAEIRRLLLNRLSELAAATPFAAAVRSGAVAGAEAALQKR